MQASAAPSGARGAAVLDPRLSFLQLQSSWAKLPAAAVLAGQIVDLQIAAAAALVRCPKEVESEMRSRWRDIDGMVKRICVENRYR